MNDTGGYGGFLAEFYDILHSGLYDVECFVNYAKDCGAPEDTNILELGCGTGRILLPLAHEGFHVTGIDNSPDMLALCKMRLGFENADVQSRVKLCQADAQTFSLDSKFDLVLATCNFLNHFRTTAHALQVLSRAKHHLNGKGIFVLDLSIPDIRHMAKYDGKTQTFDFTHPLTGASITYQFTADYDFVCQTERDHIVLEEYVDGDLQRKHETTMELAYFFPKEVRLLLKAAGFTIVREQGCLQENVPINRESGEMVFFCGIS